MRRRSHSTPTVILLCLAMTARAQDPSVYRPNNPAGIVSVPPSSYQNGLIDRTDLSESMSERVITGNVGGGKHFRAGLPYAPPHSINTELGSTYLDSFLRHSGSAEMLPHSTGMDSPFYSSTGTVTRSIPGQAAVLTPAAPRPPVQDGTYSDFSRDPFFSLSRMQTSFTADRSLARQLLTTGTPPIDPGPGRDYLQHFLHQRALIDAQPLTPPIPGSEGDGYIRSSQDTTLDPPLSETQDSEANIPAEMQTTLQALKPEQWADYFQRQKQEEDQQNRTDPVATMTDVTPPAESQDASSNASGEQTEDSPSQDLPAIEMSSAPQDALAQYVTLQAFALAKYDHFMQSGRQHQREGDYDRAADAFTLADAYKPDDPAASAGKSLALFARSQFSSSALFLARTLERQPSYALVPVDLTVEVGGTEALHKRIAEAEVFLKRSGSFDLNFLMAYVYYQINDLGMARDAIDKALLKEPEHVGAKQLRQTIQEKLGG